MVDVVLPKLGQQTVDADVMRVCVNVGDSVKIGDPLFEVESEKATFVVEAEVAGVVADLLVVEGTVVVPGQVLARLDRVGEPA